MPVGEILGEALGGVIRFAGRIVFEIVFELILVGTGRFFIHLIRPKAHPGELTCGMVGLLFWILIGVLVYGFYRAAAA